MADADLDFSDLLPAAEEIDGAVRRVAEGAYPLVKEYAQKLERKWRANARDTAGAHGKPYTRSITSEQIYNPNAAEWEVGPDRARKQGSMGAGFEYGGPTQPPHLDGARATTAVEPDFQAAVEKLAGSL
ncbi:hypothetical protein AB0L53_54695 [Nonomuraea sp. NPDC052129]|uniref:hypothetical protein n=1 Tax=Nonomuraea sp. NPDC052129 TaxID=3154651 RepID=UPI0034492917